MLKNTHGFTMLDVVQNQPCKGICVIDYKGFKVSLINEGVSADKIVVYKDEDQLFFNGTVEEVLSKLDVLTNIFDKKTVYDYSKNVMEKLLENYNDRSSFVMRDKVSFLSMAKKALIEDFKEFEKKLNELTESKSTKRVLMKRKNAIFSVKMKDIKHKTVEFHKAYQKLIKEDVK
ncbi:hypothetical protein ACTOJ1_001177 [Shigella flexneri]